MPRREQLEEMLKSDPDDVFLQYALAMAYASEGDTVAGVQRLRDVIDQNPDYVAAYFQAGQLLAADEAVDDAKDVVSRGIEVARRTGDQHAESEMSEFLRALPAN